MGSDQSLRKPMTTNQSRTSFTRSLAQRSRCCRYSFWETNRLRQPRMAQSGRAATKDPGPRMEHRLNTERESAQLHRERLFWESVFHPCSIRGSPENFVGNERFLLIVVRISRISTVQAVNRCSGRPHRGHRFAQPCGLGSDRPLGRNDGSVDTHGVQRKRYG